MAAGKAERYMRVQNQISPEDRHVRLLICCDPISIDIYFEL